MSTRGQKQADKIARGEIIQYRNQKGQLIKENTFRQLLKEGKIRYGPKTTNNPINITEYRKKISFEISGSGKYYVQNLILENGKEIGIVYRNEKDKQDIIDKIIANDISPKDHPRADGTTLNALDKSYLKNGRYAGQLKKPKEREYKDLETFIAHDYAEEFRQF